MKESLYTMRSEKSITLWDSALPLGNGKLGVLVYGDGPIILSLDRVDLWDERKNEFACQPEFTYANLVRLTNSGREEDWQERARIFERITDSYPSKITAGRILLDFGGKKEDIVSSLDEKTGIAAVTVDETRSAELFVSYSELVGVAKIKGDFTYSLRLPDYISREGKGGLGYPKAEITREGDFLYYRQNSFTDFSYGIVCLILKKGEETELWFSIGASSEASDYIAAEKEKLLAAAALGYETVKQKQIAHWRKYWAQSSVHTGDALIDKTYIDSTYLFGACSRRGFYPAPLQGIWTADNDELPPWRGDYHFDTNVQFTYSSYLVGNHVEEGAVLVDYLWSMRDVYSRFAESFFGVPGLILPCCTTLKGQPLSGWAQYSLSPTMTIWAIQVFEEHYLYTDDVTFLRERAYPMFRDVGKAIAGLLTEEDGFLRLPLSSSPEIFDNSRKACLVPNSNFDLSLLTYLYRTLVRFCDILGEDADEYKTILSKLEKPIQGRDGVLTLDRETRLEVSHRHLSQFMWLYPLRLIPFEGNEAMFRRNLKEIDMLGTSLWVGFSFPWAASLYAMAKEEESASRMLRYFCDGFVNTNGFHLNGDFKRLGYTRLHYRPFTLEANFQFLDAVQKTLLQDHTGTVELFPAAGENASFTSLRARFGLRLSAARKNGRLARLTVFSSHAQTVSFLWDGRKRSLKLKKGKNIIL